MKHSTYKVFLAAVFLAAPIRIPTYTFAQSADGKILGTITDRQKAALPGVRITILETATRAARETVTDQAGCFEVTSLPPGTYTVSAVSPGFPRTVSDEVALRINQSIRIDLSLAAGPGSEVVTATDAATTVETVSATLGHSVAGRPLRDLPLNGRHVMQLALLQPGIAEGSGRGLFSVAGGRDDAVLYLLDGGLDNNLLDNLPVFIPNPDAVAEFRLLTSNAGAEYGRYAGGMVSVVTRSGSSRLHGSAFEFLRNEAFNANSFFNNRDGLPREALKRNQFGATLGGPVVLPGILGSRDRLFFFVGYQGQRLACTARQPAQAVPTPAELTGDFSRSNATRTGPDLRVVEFLTKYPYYQSNPALAAKGIINSSRIDAVAQKYIRFGLIPSDPAGLARYSGKGYDNQDEITSRFDAVLSGRDRISATFGAGRNPGLQPFYLTTSPGFPGLGNRRDYLAHLVYNRVFTPTVLNDFHFTAQRNNRLTGQPGADRPKPADLGIGITPDAATGPTRLNFADSGLVVGFSSRGPARFVSNTLAASDTLSWVKGKHSLKFGAAVSSYRNRTQYDSYVDGEFGFYGASGSIFSGNGFADFLMGMPDEYYQSASAPSTIRSRSLAVFAQEEWHLSRRLVLTLGVRYEYHQPKYDREDRSFSLLRGARSTVFTGAPIGLLFPGDYPRSPRGANFPDRNDWAPRFGFAWDPGGHGKTSVRGGFGVFYDVLKGEDNLQFNGQAPFYGWAALYFDPLSSNPAAAPIYMSQPFAATGTANPFPSRAPAGNLNFAGAGFLPFGGSGMYFIDPRLRTPYVYQYNLSVERELARNLVLETSYVGNSSHKLTTLTDSNPFVLGTTHRIFNTTAGNTDTSFSYLDTFTNDGTGNYSSLQISLQQRASEVRGLGTLYGAFSYTLGHSIDISSGFRSRGIGRVPFYNHRQFRASSDYDVRQHLALSGGWDLPFHKMWASNRLTRGWSLYPILSYRTGLPLDIGGGLSRKRQWPGPSAAGDGDLVRANLVGSSVATYDPKQARTFGGRTSNYWFNPANFAGPKLSAISIAAVTNAALRSYGSLGRNSFGGPGRFNLDMALAKTTALAGERLAMEFRLETFNLFNRAQFRDPNTAINDPAFGTISSTYDPRILQFGIRFLY